ncbi:DUF2889 domain-containing protein [Variovorax sp. Sphag1AA]|uniref:DUF2889 domain-containing protein n=1 Tax=Variovorax sp. Sphag1AA TaxID=2587027 RepID=UPI0016161AAD|nr:DUF2889 domain-containing protein [Variovorax sp. Sphag1AA]MBB3181126.1 hypothetical protein [Variovorax sp. Sphag1AA]
MEVSALPAIERRTIEDVKQQPFSTPTQTFAAGLPMHLMALRLTVDRTFEVVNVEASMPRTPFQAVCPEATKAMQSLGGCNLLKGFRRAVAERLTPRVRCTHLAELVALLPTLAVQALVQGKAESELPSDKPPLKLDGAATLSCAPCPAKAVIRA